MKEHPLIFDGESVRAILAGTKTQTRRLLTPQVTTIDGWPSTRLMWALLDFEMAVPRETNRMLDVVTAGTEIESPPDQHIEVPRMYDYVDDYLKTRARLKEPESWHRVRPRWEVGDRIWVRETWAQNDDQLSEISVNRSFVYRADGETRALDNGGELPWRSPLHMPRWESRITLEITGIRIERAPGADVQWEIASTFRRVQT